MTDFAIRVGPEQYGEIKLIAEGSMVELIDEKTGCQVYLFVLDGYITRLTIINASLILSAHELFFERKALPNFPATNEPAGFYECMDSSFLCRIQQELNETGQMFGQHRHFICYDGLFFTHVVADGIQLERSRDLSEKNRLEPAPPAD